MGSGIFTDNDLCNDVVIWRYMDLEKFENLLQSKMLHFTSLLEFEDPLEGTVSEDFIQSYGEDYRDSIQQLRNQYFVSCWTENQYESNLLWKTYTSEPQSIAIKSTIRNLISALPDVPPKGIMIRRIDYGDPPRGKQESPWNWKSPEYSDEHEIRVCSQDPNLRNALRFARCTQTSKGWLIPVNLASLITNIVVHPLSAVGFEDQICQLVHEHGIDQRLIIRSNIQLSHVSG